MSLSIALNNALSGLQTSQAVIQVISNNVTNANTEGYSRKSASPLSRTILGAGQGVQASALSRVVDERLLMNLRSTISDQGSAKALNAYYKEVVAQFGSLANSTSLSATLSGLSTSLQNLAAAPESSAHRLTAVNDAIEVAKKLNAMSGRIQTLRYDADKEISDKLASVNIELQKIADLNVQIESAQARGDSTAELADQRDQAISKVAAFVDIRYFSRSSGAVVVTLGDGRMLADTRANTLSHSTAAAFSPDISYPAVGVTPILLNGTDITPIVKSGELKGLIDARDTVLPNLQTEIDNLTRVLRDQINLLHNAGTGLPPANSLTGTRTFADPTTDTITFSAGARIAVTDAAGQFVAHYDLPAGTYTIAQIETAIDTNLATYASASSSAGGPLGISALAAGNGIALVDLGTQDVLHTDGLTTYSGFSSYFGLNDLFITPGKVQGGSTTALSALIQVRSDIASNPSRLSRGALDTTLTPVPVAGDVAIAAGDGSVLQAIADKFLDQLSFSAAGSLALTSTTLGGYSAEILSSTTIAAAAVEKDFAFKDSLSQELSYRSQTISGVNIDEELQNLVIYENSYNATARIVQVVSDLFETLTNLGR
jgi:flagellar hook-associated protein 1 FlgK